MSKKLHHTLWSLIIVIAQQLQRGVFSNQLQSGAIFFLKSTAKLYKNFSNQLQNGAKVFPISCKVVQKLFKPSAKLCKQLFKTAATKQHFSNLIIATVKKLLFVKLPNHGNRVFLGHCG